MYIYIYIVYIYIYGYTYIYIYMVSCTLNNSNFQIFKCSNISFQSSPLGGNVNYLSAQYLKNHLMKYFPI